MMKNKTEQKDSSNLLIQTLRGIVWLLGLRAWYQVVNFFVSIILARLLLPGDFGLLGMAVVFTGFLTTVSDLGFTQAIIQRKEMTHEQLSSIFLFNIFSGIVAALILSALSIPISKFYQEPKLTPVLIALSINILLFNGAVIPNAIAQKELLFSKITKINATAMLGSGVAAISAALFGFGVWALVIQIVSSSVIILTLFWLKSDFRPSLKFSWGDLKDIWQFSLNLVGFSINNYFSRNADYLIVGHFLGSNSLGLYTLAYKLMLFPINNMVGVFSQAVFPAFVKLQETPEKIANAYIRCSRYLGLISMPAMVGLSILSKETILIVFGQKWIESAPVLTLLSLVAIFQPFTFLVGAVFTARGFTDWQFRWSLVATPVVILSFLIGVHWGILGVAAGYLVAQMLILLFGMPLMYKKAEISVKEFLNSMSIPILGASIMAPFVLIIRYALYQSFYLSTLSILFICIIAGCLVYFATLFFLREHFWPAVRDDIKMIIQARNHSSLNGNRGG